MQPSDSELLILRSWVGDEPTEDYLADTYDIVGTWDDVVRVTLRRKIALLSEQPSSLSVPGLSISNGQQIMTLQQQLKDFENAGGTGLDGDGTVVGLFTSNLVRKTNVR